jgi:deazaflavin-dependent oxidoreductase (nitroreductase family)
MSDAAQSRWNMMNLYPDNFWRRLFFRAPLWLWRLGLGPLIGDLFLILTTTGRKSGQPRPIALEYHRARGAIYVVSAFGERSNWYRNLLADPRVTVQTARATEAMRASHVIDDAELLEVYEVFKRRDPPLTHWYMRSLGIKDDPADILAKKDRMHVLRFDPIQEPTPPPLEVDLVWLWPVALITMLLIWLLNRDTDKHG